jgi:hypothetical protein
VQSRFLATPEIEGGALKDYRILILPYSIAISDREARAIEQFLERGGIVYADGATGLMDERGASLVRARDAVSGLTAERRIAPA